MTSGAKYDRNWRGLLEMTARSIAVVNMKGGVGKSSTIVALAEALAANDCGPVLVIDADTQATASYCLAGGSVLKELHDASKTLDAFVSRRFVARDKTARLSDYIRHQASKTTKGDKQPNLNISLIASSTTLRLSERDVLRELTLQRRSFTQIEDEITTVLREEIQGLSSRYEYILFDCAPGISPLTTAAISIADLILVPTVPDAPSVLGLAAFLKSVHAEMHFESSKRLPHVLITRLPRKASKALVWSLGSDKKVRLDHYYQHADRIRDLAKLRDPPFVVLKTTIPESRDMPQAMSLGADSPGDAKTYVQRYGTIAAELDSLVAEITKVL
jgi:cellulose biosynthesis protein BcsQ